MIEFVSGAFSLSWVKKEDGRKELPRTQYSDTVAKVDEEVKSSETGTSIGDGVKNE